MHMIASMARGIVVVVVVRGDCVVGSCGCGCGCSCGCFVGGCTRVGIGVGVFIGGRGRRRNVTHVAGPEPL